MYNCIISAVDPSYFSQFSVNNRQLFKVATASNEWCSKFHLSHHSFSHLFVIQALSNHLTLMWLKQWVVTWSKSMGKPEGKVASWSHKSPLPSFFLRIPLQTTRLVASAHPQYTPHLQSVEHAHLSNIYRALEQHFPFVAALISSHSSAGLLADCPEPMTSFWLPHWLLVRQQFSKITSHGHMRSSLNNLQTLLNHSNKDYRDLPSLSHAAMWHRAW